MTTIEFRDRSKRAPGGDLRVYLGRAETKRELRELEEQREVLKRLAARGEYDVLEAVKDGVVTVEHVCRLVDHHGVRDYRAHLELSPAPDLPSLDAYVDRFLATVEKKGTRRTYRIGLEHLREYTVEGERLGDRPWPNVRLHHVQDAQQQLLGRLARATVQTYTAAWSAFFDWAKNRERGEAAEAGRAPVLEVNPVREAGAWLSVRPTRHRFLTYEEYDRLVEVAAPSMKAQYATLTLCGLRGGEFRALPPAHVRDTHVSVAPWGDWVPKGYPRTDRAVRDVPVHPERLRPLLEEYREQWAGEVAFFVNPRTGNPWSGSAFRAQFYKDVESAGMESGAGGDGVSPHTCRHTFASWLALQDVQLLKIARLLGDTVETTAKYYAHLLPTDLDRTILRLFGAPSVQELTGKDSEGER